MDVPPLIHVHDICPRTAEIFAELRDYPWKQDGLILDNMTPLLIYLEKCAANKIEAYQERRCEFNSVEGNLYEDGQKYTGWHVDDEQGLASDLIALISVGATRDFKIRRNKDKKIWTYSLVDGDLIVMYGDFQQNYQHCVPKRSRVHEPWINLTYRLFK